MIWNVAARLHGRFARNPFIVKNVILLIDPDLGLVFWLGRTLDECGYESLPARSIPDGLRLIDEFRFSIHTVILNYALPGATHFISNLRRKQTAMKVIALVGEPDTSPIPTADHQLIRPLVFDQAAKMHLLAEISRCISAEYDRPRPALAAGS
jgi:DNA-binding NtrC family response regulator